METRQERRDFWMGHVLAWRDSGLKRADYCARHGLKPTTLAYWAKSKPAPSQNLTLVPVKLAGIQPQSGPVLRGAAGWRLELPADITPEWLAQLLRRLP